VRTSSLTRACRDLNVPPPTVSTQLRQFEARLGVPLLRRAGRRLEPTDAGKLVYRYADEILGLARETGDALARPPTGRPLRLVVRVDEVIPTETAHRLL
jgi:LysR family transcriptional activator of nhaA